MEQFFTDYESFFVEAQNEVHRILDALPEEALNWKPAQDMNSTAVLITHIAGAARFWVGDVASGDDSGRVRQQEFESDQSDPLRSQGVPNKVGQKLPRFLINSAAAGGFKSLNPLLLTGIKSQIWQHFHGIFASGF